jgi:O-antigen ligase
VALFLIFLVNNLKAHKGGAIFFIIMSTVLIYAFGKETIDENILPLIETDIQVYEGEKDSEALLHGRVGRWMSFLEVFSESGVVSQFIGLPAGMNDPYKFISKGAHNDYLRVLMFTGYIGITVYLIFLGSIFIRALKRNTDTRFLGLGAFAIIAMYSISTTPSLYAPLLYVLIPVICFLAIPGKGQSVQ